MSADTPRRLGRGLEALISTAKQQRDTGSDPAPERAPLRGRNCSGSASLTSRRTNFSPDDFHRARARRAGGIDQGERTTSADRRPRARGGSGSWWPASVASRAATRLGWTEIPAVVRDFDDRAMLTLALVENLQRADLNPLEEARGISASHRRVRADAAAGGGRRRKGSHDHHKSAPRTDAAPLIRQLVERGHITAGHARALLPSRMNAVRSSSPTRSSRGSSPSAKPRLERAHSTREPNGAPARRRTADRRRLTPRSSQPILPPSGSRSSCASIFRPTCTFRCSGSERGVVRITFYSADDLERLLDLIVGANRSDFD